MASAKLRFEPSSLQARSVVRTFSCERDSQAWLSRVGVSTSGRILKMWLMGSAWLGLRKRRLTARSVAWESSTGSSESVSVSGRSGVYFFIFKAPYELGATYLTST